jgi:hypothetical protein
MPFRCDREGNSRKAGPGPDVDTRSKRELSQQIEQPKRVGDVAILEAG